jgi:anti-sigma regulatory factor (Ser/Thr protein kinase)
MPADWWDSPTAIACPLSRGPQAARAARRVTRTALRDWGLGSLTDDAEAIVGEFVANAVRHASGGQVEVPRDGVGLRLMKRAGEVIFAVLDPSDAAPVLRDPLKTDESGRGLQMVDALSDIWGWSPVAGRGKAVWAILFCSLAPSVSAVVRRLPDHRASVPRVNAGD